LQKYYELEFSDNPDYLIFNESTYEHVNYNCIKIFYTGENISPNFNFCDYAIGFDHLSFSDRYYRLPLYLIATVYRPKEIAQAQTIDWTVQLSLTRDDLKKKEGFASFVYSNYLADDARKDFFERLSTYKKVNSGGSYLNNIGEIVDNKIEFEKKHKFSIAFENSSRSGYTTEKLVNSIMAETIPIYWGNPDIGTEFNEEIIIK
jgi:alpha(1,3/1,4) fucosyltransferase